MVVFFLLTHKMFKCQKDIVVSHLKTPVLKKAKTKFERKKKSKKNQIS